MMRYCCLTDFSFFCCCCNLRCSESQKRSRYVAIAACTAPRCKPTALCIPAGKWPAAHTCVNLPGLGLCPLCVENREGGADNTQTHTHAHKGKSTSEKKVSRVSLLFCLLIQCMCMSVFARLRRKKKAA